MLNCIRASFLLTLFCHSPQALVSTAYPTTAGFVSPAEILCPLPDGNLLLGQRDGRVRLLTTRTWPRNQEGDASPRSLPFARHYAAIQNMVVGRDQREVLVISADGRWALWPTWQPDNQVYAGFDGDPLQWGELRDWFPGLGWHQRGIELQARWLEAPGCYYLEHLVGIRVSEMMPPRAIPGRRVALDPSGALTQELLGTVSGLQHWTKIEPPPETHSVAFESAERCAIATCTQWPGWIQSHPNGAKRDGVAMETATWSEILDPVEGPMFIPDDVVRELDYSPRGTRLAMLTSYRSSILLLDSRDWRVLGKANLSLPSPFNPYLEVRNRSLPPVRWLDEEHFLVLAPGAVVALGYVPGERTGSLSVRTLHEGVYLDATYLPSGRVVISTEAGLRCLDSETPEAVWNIPIVP
ncbi:MAG: hypothetical protein R3F17_05220 [Planctomycetota bacterium]